MKYVPAAWVSGPTWPTTSSPRRSRSISMLRTMALKTRWDCITPLGCPELPEVYMSAHSSSISGSAGNGARDAASAAHSSPLSTGRHQTAAKFAATAATRSAVAEL